MLGRSIGRTIARVKYGPVVEEGQFEDHRDEYRDLIYSMDDVDVKVEGYHDVMPRSGLLTPTRRKTLNEVEEGVSGKKAWEFANSALEEETPNNGNLDEIPFYFEHRSRGEDDRIKMGASGISFLGSRRECYVTFDS